jgi:hypothetical protein
VADTVITTAPALFAVVGKQHGTERWRKALEVMDVVLNRNPTYHTQPPH